MSSSPWSSFLNTVQIKRDYSSKPHGLGWRSNKLFIVTAVGLALFTDLFLYALLVPVLPFMLADRVGIPPEQIQASISNLLAAYSGASVLISPIAGVITDRIGTRRAPFLVGVTALIGATVLLMLGRAIPVLLLARSLQGVSASFVWTTGMALCLETVGAENLGKAIGGIFGFISVGTLLAPMLGGVLYDKGGLGGVFGLAFALLVLDFIMRVLVIEVKVARRYEAIHEHATASKTSQQQNTTLEHEEGEAHDETTSLLPRVESSLENEYKIPDNLPNILRIMAILPCLASPRLIVALTISFVQAVLLSSIDATVPIIARESYGFSSLQAGLLFLPIGIANLTFGPLLGYCVDKFGTKRVAVLVYLYLVPVLIALGLGVVVQEPGSGPSSSAPDVARYAALLALVGIGTAGMGAPSVVEASTVVGKYHAANPGFFGEDGPYAQLYSLSFLFFSLGLAVGPEVAGRLRVGVGYGWMNALLAGVCAITAVVCFFLIGERRVMKNI
ncbi:MFS transporter [Aspergillus undulatus]|uniref:MFS transporter n=1 Tax=Aspergillus undulatus TaxID=1810928 RepID=UPI003CCDA1D7